MWIGTLALIGFPFMSGYLSKDMILEAAYASHNSLHLYAFWLGIAAAVLTAFYSGRLMFMTFHGQCRASEAVQSHIHESPAVMTVPLAVLALGAVFAGWAGIGMIGAEGEFWAGAIFFGADNHVMHDAHEVPGWVVASPTVAMLVGVSLSWLFYVKATSLPDMVAGLFKPVHTFFYNKWYFDELYDFVFVRGAKALGSALWTGGDQGIIDRYGPDGFAASTLSVARRAVRLQSGYLYHYAFAMLIGVAILVSWYLFMVQG
jgi:NADH-quinone oxidoreductase subunit L